MQRVAVLRRDPEAGARATERAPESRVAFLRGARSRVEPMLFSSRSLNRSVVLITGASSGIGRATAHAFAERGARIVLAARRKAALEEARRECEARGGEAHIVQTDVTDEEQVRALAEEAVDRFGGIDVWVNNAGVTLFGRFEETPTADFERVIRTNLFGYVYGAKAAIRQFRLQGRGVLINVASMVSYKGQPYTSAYVASKFAIRGLGECLRMELLDAPDIQVCTLLPASIDTPLFQSAANYTGRAPKAMEPVYPPELVAADIVQLAESPQRELTTGAAAQMMLAMSSVAPGLAERMMARKVTQDHLQDRAAPPGHGNLFEPKEDEARVHGGWDRLGQGHVRRIPWAALGAGALVLALAPLAARALAGSEPARAVPRRMAAR